MSLNTVQEIERAIGLLTPEEVEELRLWLDQCTHRQPIDLSLKAGLEAGHFDELILQALEDEKNGRVQPL